MTPERWQQIQSLYDAALEREPSQRAAFLADACATDDPIDEEMRRKVEALLAANAENRDLLLSGKATAILPSQPADHAGQQFGRYHLLSRLGAGGMGEVYLATDTRLERRVALKVLPAEFTQNTDRVRRFMQEAKATSALNHPNIISVYDFGESEVGRFIVMEYVSGRTLRAVIAEDNSLATFLSLSSQMAKAISAAHAAGITHRDIKPDNIMVRDDGYVKVLDFGLARLLQTNTNDSEAPTLVQQTTPGTIMGTVAYMSPEQARGEPVSYPSDIFALGIVFYELATGRHPFKSETMVGYLHAITLQTPVPLTKLKPELPVTLNTLILQMLEKEAQARPTASAITQTLWEIERQNTNANSEKRDTSTNDLPASQTNSFPQPAQLATFANPEAESVRTGQALAQRKAKPTRKWWLGLVAAGLLGAMAWLWFGRNQSTDVSIPFTALKTTELVNWNSTPGEVYSAGKFSPDGKRIAYASTQSGVKNIWVKQVKEGSKGQQITTDEFINDNPIWSPDGEEIAYFSLRGNHNGIWRIPYLGGTPTELVQVEDGGVELRGWAKSNTIYYQLKGNLYALDVAQRTVSQITQFDSAKAEAAFLRISPDESRIAYRGVDEKRNNTLWIMPKGGGTAVAVANHPADIRNIVWHPDGERLLYSANVEGNYQVYLAYVDGRPPVSIPTGLQEAFVLDVLYNGTDEGAKILVGSSKEESDVWGVNLAKRAEFAIATEINSELWPAVSPDGKTLVFQSIRNLSQGDKLMMSAMVTKATIGSGQSTEVAQNGFLPQWSPDGRQLAFLRWAGKSADLFLIDSTGGKESKITSGLPAMTYSILPYNRIQTTYFQWSPDGRRLVYYSRKNGQQNLWLVNADGSDDRQLTQNTDANLLLHCPIWSADGKRIAYIAKTNTPGADGKVIFSLWVIDITTAEAKQVHQANVFINLLGWSADGTNLVWATLNYHSVTSAPLAVSLLTTASSGSATRTITNLAATYFYNIHLSPDGQRIAYVARQDDKDNLWVLPLNGGAPQKFTANQDARLYFSSLAWASDGQAIYFGKQSRYSLLTMVANIH